MAASQWYAHATTACLLVLFPRHIAGRIPADGSCGLHVFVPFTARMNDQVGTLHTVGTEVAVEPSTFLTTAQEYSLGYFQMAAGFMAMEDFNSRESTITPELQNLTKNCNVKFDMDNSVFVDTSTLAHTGTTELVTDIKNHSSFPCAIAGPFGDLAAQNIAALAAATKVPHIPHRGYNFRLADPMYSPYTNMVFPDMIVIGEACGRYLKHIQRDKYIAVLNTASSDTGIQRGEGIGIGMEKAGVSNWENYAYSTPMWYVSAPNRSILDILARVKKRGYRTIVVAMEIYYLELPFLADAAEALGMNNGEYVWIFHPNFEMESIYNLINAPQEIMQKRGLPSFANVTKLLQGSTLLQPVEPYQYLGDEDLFWQSWKSKDAAFVERLNNYTIHNSIVNAEESKEQATPDFFQVHPPQLGTSYLYDAILAIGIGACAAHAGQTSGSEISGVSHVKAIHSSQFQGATGRIQFDAKYGRNTRNPKTATMGVFNLYPLNNDTSSTTTHSFEDAFVLTKIVTGLSSAGTPKERWEQVGPALTYANGLTTPPELLRDAPEQNYLSKGFQIFGLALMAINVTSALACLVWVLLHWNCRVVRAAQPYFLVLLLLGAAVSSLCILGHSFDENSGFSTETLDKLCMMGPWLATVGHLVTYGALFTKLWRINKVLQFSRKKINTNAVAAPMFALILLAIVILMIWTIVDPSKWQREEIDEITGESIGQCSSDSLTVFLPLLLVVGIIPPFLTCFMAWKTRDVDDMYSESSWIFTLVVVQIQVLLVGIPVAVILSDISTDGSYLGKTLVMFTIPMSMILLIMVPKIVRHYQDLRGGPVKRIRGAHAGVAISGISQLATSHKTATPRTSSQVPAPYQLESESHGPKSSGFNSNGAPKLHDSYQINFDHVSESSETSNDKEERQREASGTRNEKTSSSESNPSFHFGS